MKRIIAIEGADGVGKQTQVALLKESFEKEGYVVHTYAFPNYGSKNCKLVEDYLQGRKKLTPEEAVIAFAQDRGGVTRTKKFIKQFENEKEIIIFDRFHFSKYLYDDFIIDVYNEEECLEDKRKRILKEKDVEEILTLIKSEDVFTIVLKLDNEIQKKVLIERHKTEEADIYEKRENFQKAVYDRICWLEKNNIDELNYVVLECDNGNERLSVEEVQKKLINIIKNA